MKYNELGKKKREEEKERMNEIKIKKKQNKKNLAKGKERGSMIRNYDEKERKYQKKQKNQAWKTEEMGENEV